MTKTKPEFLTVAMIFAVHCAFGADIPIGADLADMYDYYHYLGVGTAERAQHSLTAGGEYTLSADRVWSALAVKTTLGEPANLNLGGHTLTLNGCDATTIRPLSGNDNSTLVISNGTVRTIYDPDAYPWTRETGGDDYSKKTGVYLSRNSNDAVGSRIVVANGGNLILNNDATVLWKGGGHSLVVENGGVFDGKLGFAGRENRYVFKSGSTFSKISGYINGSHAFPQNIWFESGQASNVIEICDSGLLTAAGITSLTPDANATSGSFHCGLAVSSADFNWSSAATISVGTKSDNAPVLFEMKDGARITTSGELFLGTAVGGSGTWMTLDGAGTIYKATGTWAGRIGVAENVSNVVLRLSNGAHFDASGATLRVGQASGANCNSIEVLSGSHLETRTLGIGPRLNYGNRVIVSGAGSTMTNVVIELGNDSKAGGRGHSLTVAEHGKVNVVQQDSKGGTLHIGYTCRDCMLKIVDCGEVHTASDVLVGYGDRVLGCSNRVVVCSGGILAADKRFLGYGNSTELVVSNGTLSASTGIAFGTNGIISVSGQYAFLQAVSGGLNFGQGGTLKISVPKSGFTDVNDAPRAPLNVTGPVSFDDALNVEIDVREMGRRHGAVKETPLLYVSAGISDGLLSKITVNGESCQVKRSGDGKTLKAVRSDGLVMFVR